MPSVVTSSQGYSLNYLLPEETSAQQSRVGFLGHIVILQQFEVLL